MRNSPTFCPLRSVSLSLALLFFVGYGAYAQDLGEVLPGEERAATLSEVAFLFLRLLAIESGVKVHSTLSLSRT